MKHLETNKILTNLNHGFRSPIIRLLMRITTTDNNKRLSERTRQRPPSRCCHPRLLQSLWYNPHNKLLHKLDQYGIKGSIHTWLRNFLTTTWTRKVRTIVEGETSSVLLFAFFIVPSNKKTITKLYMYIKRDYRSRERGCITKMRKELELETLEERRQSLRLILMYKVVKGLVPALPTNVFVTFSKRKRQIKPKTFGDCVTINPVEKHKTNN